MSVVDILRDLQKAQAQLIFVALSCYLFRFKRLDSFSTTVMLILLLSGVHMFIENILWSYGTKSDGEHWREAIALWHACFSISDFGFMVLIYFANKFQKFPVTDFMTFTVRTYFILGLIQVVRYGDRMVFETNYLAEFYKYAIPSLNIGITLVVMGITFAAIRSDVKLKGSIS